MSAILGTMLLSGPYPEDLLLPLLFPLLILLGPLVVVAGLTRFVRSIDRWGNPGAARSRARAGRGARQGPGRSAGEGDENAHPVERGD